MQVSSKFLSGLAILVLFSGLNDIYAEDINSYSTSKQIEAISKKVSTIKMINNPSAEVQMAAVKQEPWAITYISNPTKEAQLYSVQMNPRNIEYINNPHFDVAMEVIRKDGALMRFVQNPTREIQLQAIKERGSLIQYVSNPDKEMQLIAIKNDPTSIEFITNPDREIQLIAVRSNPDVIKFINNPDAEIRYLGEGVGNRPVSYKIGDKKIAIKVINQNEIEVTNFTNEFMTVNSLAEYYGVKIYSQDSFTVPPQGVSIRTLNTIENAKIKSLDDMVTYGFAVQYTLPNSNKPLSLFKTTKIKASSLLQ